MHDVLSSPSVKSCLQDLCLQFTARVSTAQCLYTYTFVPKGLLPWAKAGLILFSLA